MGAAIALLNGIYAWIIVFVAPISIAGAAIFIFIVDQGHSPWVLHGLQIFTTSVLVFTQRSRFETKRQLTLVETERNYLFALSGKRKLEKEKAEAVEIAAAFIPEPFPTVFGPYKVSGYHRCFDAASGDWYFS